MIRLVDTSARTPVDFGGSSAEGSVPADGNPYRLADAPNGTTPFALWARQTGLLGAYGHHGGFQRAVFRQRRPRAILPARRTRRRT